MTRQILFVCTGNVFRSLTAEYALRAVLDRQSQITVAAAGTEDYAHTVAPQIADYLMRKGLDVRAHRRRTLTREIVDAAQLVIAMSLDHRDFIRVRYGRSVPVFLECCGGPAEALLDLHEAVGNHRINRAASLAYIHATIDRIIDLTPCLAARIPSLLSAHSQ